MDKSNIKLTTAEISILWRTYIQCTAMQCFYKYLLHTTEDKEIKSITREVVNNVDSVINKIESIYKKEHLPIPKGFSDEDINFKAPALFTDLFALSFVYRGGQMIIPYYAITLTKISRLDIYELFSSLLTKESNLHKKALSIMLSKGLYDRPPKMEYPNDVEFIQQHPSLIATWAGEKRPLNTLEITELFKGIERNAIGMNLLMGLIQVTTDKQIKNYLLKGKKLAEKQINKFDTYLKENDHFAGFPTTMEVKNSTVSPFSDKLILFIISTSNQIAVSALGDALSVSMRKDVGVTLTLFIAEILKYGEDGLELLIERGWMEQPPQPIDRNQFYKT